MKKRVLCAFLACAAALSLAIPAWAAGPVSYSDVPRGHWAYDAIMEMTREGILNGTSAAVNGVSRFSPDALMTRAEFITALAREFATNTTLRPPAKGQPWYQNYLNTVIELGLVMQGEFDDMNAPMLRQEMALTLDRATRFNDINDPMALRRLFAEPTFLVASKAISDFDTIGSAYQQAVQRCFTLGILGGVDSSGTFDPMGKMTRAQAALVIYRLINPFDRLSPDFSQVDWVNTAGKSDEYDSRVPGRLADEESLLWNAIERPATLAEGGSWDDYNGYLYDLFGRYFYSGGDTGMDATLESDKPRRGGHTANILCEPHKWGGKDTLSLPGYRWGIEVFGWRHDFATSEIPEIYNVVLEALYYGCGDAETTYALWSLIDYLCISGSDFSAGTAQRFGFAYQPESAASGTLSMKGLDIYFVNHSSSYAFYVK